MPELDSREQINQPIKISILHSEERKFCHLIAEQLKTPSMRTPSETRECSVDIWYPEQVQAGSVPEEVVPQKVLDSDIVIVLMSPALYLKFEHLLAKLKESSTSQKNTQILVRVRPYDYTGDWLSPPVFPADKTLSELSRSEQERECLNIALACRKKISDLQKRASHADLPPQDPRTFNPPPIEQQIGRSGQRYSRWLLAGLGVLVVVQSGWIVRKQLFQPSTSILMPSISEVVQVLGLHLLVERNRDREPDSTNARQRAQERCAEGDGESCAWAGILLERAVARNGGDSKQAIDYYQKACDKNTHWACLEAGVLKAQANPKNPKELEGAQRLLKKSEENRIDGADDALGVFYWDAAGENKDRKVQACTLFQKACSHNHADGCAHLYVCMQEKIPGFDAGQIADAAPKACKLDERYCDLGISRTQSSYREALYKSCRAGSARGCRKLGQYLDRILPAEAKGDTQHLREDLQKLREEHETAIVKHFEFACKKIPQEERDIDACYELAQKTKDHHQARGLLESVCPLEGPEYSPAACRDIWKKYEKEDETQKKYAERGCGTSGRGDPESCKWLEDYYKDRKMPKEQASMRRRREQILSDACNSIVPALTPGNDCIELGDLYRFGHPDHPSNESDLACQLYKKALINFKDEMEEETKKSVEHRIQVLCSTKASSQRRLADR